jgi:hypothetical protein
MLVKLNALLIILKSQFLPTKKQHNLTKRICLKITNSQTWLNLHQGFFISCFSVTTYHRATIFIPYMNHRMNFLAQNIPFYFDLISCFNEFVKFTWSFSCKAGFVSNWISQSNHVGPYTVLEMCMSAWQVKHNLDFGFTME